jgi:hypothetical protein
MNSVIAKISLSVASIVVASSAFAGGGIGHAGAYHADTYQPAAVVSANTGLTRAEVRAGIVEAYDNGTLPALNRNTYPDRSMAGDAIAAQHEIKVRDAALAEQRNRSIVEYANGSATQSGKAAIQ